ncbi:CinA family protein [Caldisericum exile]|uniref:CinA family protein n=1 Tax=Caldisericum exile TaxID=693075 RepID=UPI0002E86E7E|nr:CinA family protein [Caldisericum exile]
MQKLVNTLKERNLTIATAESVTGGLVAKSITDVPGSSKVFLGGIIAYSPNAKVNILKIDETLIKKLGTVDPLIAEIMARNVKGIFGADVGVSTTGIAGPDSIEGKQVGLCYVGIVIKDENFVFENKFEGDRAIIREYITEFLINKLIEILQGG